MRLSMPGKPARSAFLRFCFSQGLLILFVVMCLAGAFIGKAHARQGFAAIAVDARTGKVLYARNADAPRIPASVTKVMTLYILFGEIRRGRYGLGSRLMISRHAAAQQPSKLGLPAGRTISVDDAIRVVVTKSANDIAVAIAENIAGSESAFARRMTRTARAIGMTRTIFRNASGLPRPANVTTARDLATLALRLQRDYPRLYKRYFGLRYARYGRRVFRNHNRLLGRVRGMDGLKTGYTRAAGYNLAASALRNGKRIVAVVLGGRTGRARNAFMARLIEQMFRTKPLRRGTRIAALAGMPPGLSRQMARRISAPRATVAAKKPPAARPRKRPAQIAALEKARRERNKAVPVPAARPAAIARKTARPPAPEPAPKPRARPVEEIRLAEQPRAQKPVETAQDKAKQPANVSPTPAQGVTFASVRPSPAPARQDAHDAPGKAEDKPEISAKTKGLYASLAVRPAKELEVVSDASHEEAGALHTADVKPARETVIAKTDGTLTADALSLPARRAPGVRLTVTAKHENALPLKDAEKQKGQARNAAIASYLKTWNIQLGAFPAREGAKKRLDKVRRDFRPYVRGKAAFTMVFQKGSATYYRARFAGFSRATARRACRVLKRKGVACFALAPKNS